MYAIAESQETDRSLYVDDNMFLDDFCVNLNQKTTSFLDIYNDVLYLNFGKRRFKKSHFIQKNEGENILSKQTDVLEIELPIYYSDNRNKINLIYKEVKEKQNIDSIQIENHVNFLINSLSELDFKDIYLEITKSNLLKFSILFDGNKILIISKDFTENNNDVVYSYFINSQMIATNVSEILSFVEKFKEYISL